MKIPMADHEKNWLKKNLDISGSSYYLEADGPIAKTIRRELNTLFLNITAASEEQAMIVFQVVNEAGLGEEGYRIAHNTGQYMIQGNTERALLYGMYACYRMLLTADNVMEPVCSIPSQSIRMLNHWDNFDGSIERGYAGASIFYSQNQFRNDEKLLRQYAGLLASIGINALSINNVNVHKVETTFITEARLKEIKPIADIMSEYGIQLFLSINFAAPMLIGSLDTADPADPQVAAWWQGVAATVYQMIPQFGGFVVKADSEGEPGPFTYGRNHTDGANMLAQAVKPFGGIVIWRCFVYNCQQDWRDRSIDRAKAQYDNFVELDGKFAENVILQIKNGPIDFQVREPVSPLFGALKKTNQILEYQITQEYTGQQKHIFYLLPMWKTVLDFDTGYPGADSRSAAVRDVIRTNSPVKANSGISAVVNVGMDSNWTGHKLAQANLYGYGRMIWDNRLDSAAILKEWVALTFDLPPEQAEVLEQIMLSSGETYEYYTAPHGIGFMVAPNHHYGPAVDGYEYDRWGTYHFADRLGIGVDRTLATGTGYTRQYSDLHFAEYENLSTCPDELLLFFHHVPYTYVLKSGKTLIQSIYDTHFEGVERVEQYIRDWDSLKNELDAGSYQNVKERLQEQYRCAREWRDQINTYFYRKSGIPDEKGREIYR